MPQFCFIWCSICGGVLDTVEEDGERRSRIKIHDLRSLFELTDEEVVKFQIDESGLSMHDIEWLSHYRVLGPVTDEYQERNPDNPLWSPDARNESHDPSIFVSQEAKIEDSRQGEIVWVPGPPGSKPIEYRNDWDDYEPRCMYRDWILVSPRDLLAWPFEHLVAHSHCLALFDTYASHQRRKACVGSTNPLTLPELVKALELRRVFNRDVCFCMIRNRSFERMVLWEHSFFGVQSAWSGDCDPWERHAGYEVYCADPVEISQLTEFARLYNVSANADRDGTATATSHHPSNSILDLPRELLDAILSSLPLRSVASVRSTCRKAHAILSDVAPLWRTRAIKMHSWFWELKDRDVFPQYTTNWRQLLKRIETTRSAILDSAGILTQADGKARLHRFGTYDGDIYPTKPFGNESSSKLPLGLTNRLRIWCCIASIGKDGKQITLQGQKKGLDPSNVPEWDGVSHSADCPRCGRWHGISFNRLKLIAGRTDLT